MTPDEEGCKPRLGKYIENAIEDSLTITGNDVSTFTQTPRNWGEEPQQDGLDTADEIGSRNVTSEDLIICTTLEDHNPGHKEEGSTTECIETPFIGRFDQRTHQTSHNHDFIDQDGIDDVGKGRPQVSNRSRSKSGQDRLLTAHEEEISVWCTTVVEFDSLLL